MLKISVVYFMWNQEICQDPPTCRQDDLVLYLIKLSINVNIMKHDLLDMKHFWKFYEVRSKKFFFITNSWIIRLYAVGVLVLVFSWIAILWTKMNLKKNLTIMFYPGTSLLTCFFQLCGLLLHGLIMGWLRFPNQFDSNARFYPNDLRKV